ncbi:MAG: phosphoribosylformimino-5-aminoimidazole carboxamide ribotide isomerase [Actinobacteria bacterium]|nr:phosphoribosylformimino-5-aminoimidazole carboxamide ribotide isomerase [Actinomycetota bacterium]
MFRPCIDLRQGHVVQIVGATLTDDPAARADEVVNFVSEQPAEWFAAQYRDDGLTGGHVIMLGPGNEPAARAALAAWPGGLQVGGGISVDNAMTWLDAGASHVVITSWLFIDGTFSAERLAALVDTVGTERLVLDLSCRWRNGSYWVVTDRWQRFTSLEVSAHTLETLASNCAEFLVHGVDVEGRAQGIDLDLVTLLGATSPIPTTYAGGARSLDDLRIVHEVSQGRVDLTIGSALDLFGGHGVRYTDCVEFNRTHR